MYRSIEDTVPWYRQFWPWVLIAIPALTVVAGFITLYLAIVSNDGVVEDDYYKAGLAINQSFARDRAAAARHIAGFVRVTPTGDGLELFLSGDHGDATPVLKLLHATRANLDQQPELELIGGGQYRARLDGLAPGKWYVKLQGEDGSWEVEGVMVFPHDKSVRLTPQVH